MLVVPVLVVLVVGVLVVEVVVLVVLLVVLVVLMVLVDQWWCTNMVPGLWKRCTELLAGLQVCNIERL